MKRFQANVMTQRQRWPSTARDVVYFLTSRLGECLVSEQAAAWQSSIPVTGKLEIRKPAQISYVVFVTCDDLLISASSHQHPRHLGSHPFLDYIHQNITRNKSGEHTVSRMKTLTAIRQ